MKNGYGPTHITLVIKLISIQSLPALNSFFFPAASRGTNSKTTNDTKEPLTVFWRLLPMALTGVSFVLVSLAACSCHDFPGKLFNCLNEEKKWLETKSASMIFRPVPSLDL